MYLDIKTKDKSKMYDYLDKDNYLDEKYHEILQCQSSAHV